MKKIILLIFFFSFTYTFAQSNDLFKSIYMKKAYEKGTRTENGKPGENYWINKTDYVINAELDPETRIITGNVSLTYHNESPDTLKEIVLRLYPDLYKKGTARDYAIDTLALTSGVKIKKLVVGKENIDLSDSNKNVRRYATNLMLKLDKVIEPGSKVDVDVDYSMIVPNKTLVRMGAYEDSSFFISYWYPQMSVYDDVYGWDKLNYTGTAEMYNDFNNYDVHITLPKDYIVWATGSLQNPDKVFSDEYLKKYKEAFKSDTTYNIVTEEDLEEGGITKDNDKNTWHYKADKVPDFAFATAKNYLWDGSGLTLPGGKRIFVDAAYRVKSEDFRDVNNIERKTILYLSTEMPGVEYPFTSMTVFNGAGGMEYPMMVNDGSTSSYSDAVYLTSHEITHTYFPFYMGTNERRFAFMDEGFAVFLPYAFQSREGKENSVSRSTARYKRYASDGELVPPMVPSSQLMSAAYRAASYSRPALAYYFLQDMLGEDVFLKCLQEFIYRWNYKHPIPYDMFYTFNEVSGQNLNWYWQKWFFDFADPDLRIKEYINDNSGRKVIIENDGGLPLPIHLKVYYKDGDVEVLKTTAEVWKEGNTTYEVKIDSDKKITQIDLGDESVPDLDDADSSLKLNEM